MKSSLFFMEQLAAILVFAAFASVCVSIFASSYVMSRESKDMNNALIIAENGAECFKAASGDAQTASQLLGGTYTGSSISVYYDENRLPCDESAASYTLRIVTGVEGGLRIGEISVLHVGGQILAFSVAAAGR